MYRLWEVSKLFARTGKAEQIAEGDREEIDREIDRIRSTHPTYDLWLISPEDKLIGSFTRSTDYQQ